MHPVDHEPQDLDQLDVRIDLFEQSRLFEQIGDAAALNQFSFEDFLGLAGKKLADQVHPLRDGEDGAAASAYTAAARAAAARPGLKKKADQVFDALGVACPRASNAMFLSGLAEYQPPARQEMWVCFGHKKHRSGIRQNSGPAQRGILANSTTTPERDAVELIPLVKQHLPLVVRVGQNHGGAMANGVDEGMPRDPRIRKSPFTPLMKRISKLNVTWEKR